MCLKNCDNNEKVSWQSIGFPYLKVHTVYRLRRAYREAREDSRFQRPGNVEGDKSKRWQLSWKDVGQLQIMQRMKVNIPEERLGRGFGEGGLQLVWPDDLWSYTLRSKILQTSFSAWKNWVIRLLVFNGLGALNLSGSHIIFIFQVEAFVWRVASLIITRIASW